MAGAGCGPGISDMALNGFGGIGVTRRMIGLRRGADWSIACPVACPAATKISVRATSSCASLFIAYDSIERAGQDRSYAMYSPWRRDSVIMHSR